VTSGRPQEDPAKRHGLDSRGQQIEHDLLEHCRGHGHLGQRRIALLEGQGHPVLLGQGLGELQSVLQHGPHLGLLAALRVFEPQHLALHVSAVIGLGGVGSCLGIVRGGQSVAMLEIARQGPNRGGLLASQVTGADAQLVSHVLLGQLLHVTLGQDLVVALSGCARRYASGGRECLDGVDQHGAQCPHRAGMIGQAQLLDERGLA